MSMDATHDRIAIATLDAAATSTTFVTVVVKASTNATEPKVEEPRRRAAARYTWPTPRRRGR